jgi:general secretion pathway protein D
VTINFPNADVASVAKAVLGDILGLQYSVSPDLHTPVTVVTQRPIARADVLKFFEAALANADLALVSQNGVYGILPTAQARGVAPLAAPGEPGFATETITLNFVNAEDLKRLIDPIMPGVIVRAEPVRNLLVVSGTPGQRTAAHDLVRQFDVDWLRSTSFALFVPQRTDSRLIVPELDRMINQSDSPTRGLVKLIAMDRLNGIVAISTQRQYLEDVRRWVEILDREGENNQPRIFVYRVQNGRSADLAKVLANAFGRGANGASAGGVRALSRDDLNLPVGAEANATTAPGIVGVGGAVGAAGPGGPSGQSVSPGIGPQSGGGWGGGAAPGTGGAGFGQSSDQSLFNAPDHASGAPISVDIASDTLHAKISSDETNNAIVVYARPRDYAVIEEALRTLDVLPSQVLIEAAIVEVTLTDNLKYGVQWQFSTNHTSSVLSQGPTAAALQNFPGFQFAYANAGISATLNALENLTKIKVVSAPRLLVLNNQTAALQVGQQVPIVTGSAVSTIGSNAPIVNAIEYRDTGILLKITPRVNAGGVVLLDMAQEVSQVEPDITTPGLTSPTISTRRISTSVAVQDGEVLLLGGLISSNVSAGSNGIPYLNRIPVLGALFGDKHDQGTRTELIVLLRPRVVRDVNDGRAITNELETKLRSLRPLLEGSSLP